jgi:hypothetical protein
MIRGLIPPGRCEARAGLRYFFLAFFLVVDFFAAFFFVVFFAMGFDPFQTTSEPSSDFIGSREIVSIKKTSNARDLCALGATG